MSKSSVYWANGSYKKPIGRKLKRFKSGSKEAKRYMRQLRGIKKGSIKERRRTYRDGLY